MKCKLQKKHIPQSLEEEKTIIEEYGVFALVI